MMRMLAILLLTGATAAPAVAASITNRDSDAVVLSIVENGNRSELALAAGQTETVCRSGCFVTLPNGDRVGLSGNEKVEITGGADIIK